jgi:hypothetical protein
VPRFSVATVWPLREGWRIVKAGDVWAVQDSLSDCQESIDTYAVALKRVRRRSPPIGPNRTEGLSPRYRVLWRIAVTNEFARSGATHEIWID